MNNDTSSRAGEAKRIRFNFWLDMAKDLDSEIKSLITTLKDERLFTQTIRDGLRLMNNLRKGKLDVLFELFPWVKAEFMDYMRELQPVSEAQSQPAPAEQPTSDTAQQGSDELKALEIQNELLRDMIAKQDERIADLEQKLDHAKPAHVDFESLLNSVANRIEQKLDTVTMPAVGQMPPPDNPSSLGGLQPLGSSNGLNSLTTQRFDAPIYDDDDDELEVSEAKSSGKAALNFLQSLSAIQKH